MRFFSFKIIAFLICAFSLSAYGQGGGDRVYTFQDHASIFGKNNISLSLIPLLRQGFEVNYDRRLVERHWLRLSPIYFRIEDYKQSFPEDMRRLTGYGAKFSHKYFPYANTEKKLGFFLSYGPTYQYIDLETKNHKRVVFDKIGFECVIGTRKVFLNVFYYEFHIGLASNYLNVRNDETADWRAVLEKHNTMWFDYGKTGNFVTLGFSLGVLF
ncbi:MAG: hypothetical protein FWG79_06300 [Bacteroidales bacterium]|nr:hypothetical protein [Bacteroidales bacterium]